MDDRKNGGYIPSWFFLFKSAREEKDENKCEMISDQSKLWFVIVIFYINIEPCMVIIRLLPFLTLRTAVQTASPYSLVAKHL